MAATGIRAKSCLP